MLAPVDLPAPPRRSRRAVLRASLSRFLTVEVAGAAVTVRTPGAEVTVRSDRDGYLDAVVDDPGLAPGWHEVELALDGGAPVRAPVLVVAPDVRLGLVSDVDDTILETGLTRGLEFLRVTLLTEVGERAPLPGAAALYRALVGAARRRGPAGVLPVDQPVEPARHAGGVPRAARLPLRAAAAHRLGPRPRQPASASAPASTSSA